MALNIGDVAPDFSVNDQDGKNVKLSDFRGKKLILYFYPKDMTPGCTAESCNLRDNYKRLSNKGYAVLGISSDNEKTHRKFIEKEKLPFSLLADTEKTVHQLYGTWVEKSMYGRKYMGTARITFVINEKGLIEDIIEKVDTKEHTRQILKEETKKPASAKKAASSKPTPQKTTTKKTIHKKASKKTSPKTKKR